MKKLLAIILVIMTMIVTLASCSDGAEATSETTATSTISKATIQYGVEEVLGSEISYELNPDKKSYTITGGGNYDSTEEFVIDTYNGLPITHIDEGAFGGSSIVSVTISDNVINIGERAFANCGSLTIVTIPSSVISIGDHAFRSCQKLTTVTINEGVRIIGENAFADCTSLADVTIPTSITNVGRRAFVGSQNLKYNEYDNAYYLGNADNPYLLLANVKHVNIKTCNINENTKVIAPLVFASCDEITSIDLPENVENLSDVLFSNCTKLKYREDDIAYYLGNDDNPYVLMMDLKDRCKSSYSINPKTKALYSGVFSSCDYLENITIPENIKSIPERAFYSCDKLTDITIPNSVTSIGKSAFAYCTALTNITIPSSVTEIGDGAFEKTALTNISIPESITTINMGVFYDCMELTNIIIPNSVTEIKTSSFEQCTGLTEITFNGTKSEWRTIKKEQGWNNSTGDYVVKCTDGDIAKADDN